MPHAKLMMPLCKSDTFRGIFNMSWGRCHFWRGIVNLHEGIVHFWRGINNFAWGIVVVAWGIVDIEKGIGVVEESPFHSARAQRNRRKPRRTKDLRDWASTILQGLQERLCAWRRTPPRDQRSPKRNCPGSTTSLPVPGTGGESIVG
jgi:hypothetical protein